LLCRYIILFLLYVTTVKKYVPPLVCTRRYRIGHYCWISFLNPTYQLIKMRQRTPYIAIILQLILP
jgi:hypothetical protein